MVGVIQPVAPAIARSLTELCAPRARRGVCVAVVYPVERPPTPINEVEEDEPEANEWLDDWMANWD